MVTEADCRAHGMPDAEIESMRRNGFFQPIGKRADIRDEIEGIDADLVGMLEELAEVKARIAEARARRAELVAALRTLRPAK